MKIDLREKSNVPPTAEPNPSQIPSLWPIDTNFGFDDMAHSIGEQNQPIAPYFQGQL